MKNISPKDAKTTSEVLDRVLTLRRQLDTPKEISLRVTADSILIAKTLLAIYQPTPFSHADFSLALAEGKHSKGGRNSAPSTSRPAPPKGQGRKKTLDDLMRKDTSIG